MIIIPKIKFVYTVIPPPRIYAGRYITCNFTDFLKGKHVSGFTSSLSVRTFKNRSWKRYGSGGPRPWAEGWGEGARFGLLTLVAFLSSVISSIFIQNEGEGGGGPSGPLSLDPPLHGNNWCCQLNISQTIRNGNKWGKYWHSICKYMTQIKRC